MLEINTTNTSESYLLIKQNSDLSNQKEIDAIKKTTYWALSDVNPELKGVRKSITELAQEKREYLVYFDNETKEHIFLNGGSLIGHIKGRYFCCWCYIPGCKLFFRETPELNKLKSAPEMKPDRIRILLSDLDEYFAKDESAKYLRLQMQSVREMWEFLHTNNAHNSFTNYQAKQQQDIQLERQQTVKKQVSEAQAAAERRRQNEERTRQRKAAREAERLKRKKIEETRKRVNADAAKATAERKAMEEKRRIAAIEAKKKEFEMQQKQEEERIFTLMMNTFKKHKTLPPVFEYDKNGSKCFYLKINNKVMHLVMHPQKPRCQILTETTSSFLTPHDLMDVFTNIETHLNGQGKIESVLEQLPSFYAQCCQIEKIKNDPNTKLVSPMSVYCENKDAPALYKKICTRLMTPSGYPYNMPISQRDR